MHSRFDSNLTRAEAAEIAQLLRDGAAFGSVAFSENASIPSDGVHVEAGYDDCLPLLGGGCWRDPATLVQSETTT
ncbi:MAG: hypothetical protein AAF085_11050 [Planctomycetota bacterium]